jgi:hypothetical protein
MHLRPTPSLLCLAAACCLSAPAPGQPFEPGPPPAFEPGPPRAFEGEEPPPPPPASETGEPIEPEITIKPGREGTITEYRVQGQLYMIKVTPANPAFPPYYLVDEDGDGVLDVSRPALQHNFYVPAWVIYRW